MCYTYTVTNGKKELEYEINQDGCYICISHSTGSGGYPVLKRNGKFTRGHRLVYEQIHGPIPPGMIVRHTCDVRNCINPNHLVLGTPADNVRDMHNRGRANPPRFLGSSNPASKLTEEQILAIKELLKAGQPHATIAKQYNVSRTTIHNIKVGNCWSQVKS